MYVEYKGPLKHTLIEMQQDLQSSISYAGGKELEAIRNVDYVVVKNSIFNGDKDTKVKNVEIVDFYVFFFHSNCVSLSNA